MAFQTIKNFFLGKGRNTETVLQQQGFQQLLTTQRFNMSDPNGFAMLGNQAIYSDCNLDNIISKGYEAAGAVHRILDTAATKFGSIPQYVFKRDGNKSNGIYKDLEGLLNRPNDHQGWYAFRYEYYMWFLLTGEAFIYLNRGDITDVNNNQFDEDTIKKTPVLQMHVLPSNRIEVIPDPNDIFGVTGYYFDGSGTREYIDKTQMIHIKNVSMRWDATKQYLRGMSPLKPSWKTLELHESATDSLNRSIQNDGVKGALFAKPDPNVDAMTDEQKMTIKEVISKRVNGSDLKGSIAWLGEQLLEYISMGSTNDELQTIAARDSAFKDLCNAFGVPPELFDTSGVNYANKGASMVSWVSNRVIPHCKLLDEELNRVLLIAFNLSNVAYIESDPSDLYEFKSQAFMQFQSLNSTEFMTINEKRKAVGYEPINSPNANQIYIEGVPESEWTARNSQNQMQMDNLNNQINGSDGTPEVPA